MKSMTRLTTVALGASVALAVAGSAAYAAWSITATNPTANAQATALGSVTGVGSTVTSSSVTLTWTAPSGVPATGYTVTRTAPTSAAVCTNVALTTCTDIGLSASTLYTYSVVALRGLWAGPAVSHSATTSSSAITRTFTVSVSGAATAGTAKDVSLTALNNGVTDLTYTGSHTLTFSGAANSPSGATPTTSQAVTFTNGVGTASLTFVKAETFTLTVSEASPARSGSTSVTVNAGAANRLAFTTTTGLPVGTNCTLGCTVTGLGSNPNVSSKVSVTDSVGNTVSNIGTALNFTVTKTSGGNALTNASLTIPASGLAESSAAFGFTAGTANYSVTITAPTTGGFTQVQMSLSKN